MKQRGAAAVEFGILLPILLILLALIVDLGRYTYQYNVLQKAARETGRYLSRLPPSNPADPSGELDVKDPRYGNQPIRTVAANLANNYCSSLGAEKPCLTLTFEDTLSTGDLRGTIAFGNGASSGRLTLVRVTIGGFQIRTLMVGTVMSSWTGRNMVTPTISATFVQG